MEKILSSKKEALLLGNEAVVRGALESGLKYAASYPGTPASEIGNLLAKVAQKKKSIYFEFGANEKLALESAAGAAFSGLPSLVGIKHYGLNVALDSLLPLVYLECPLVVVVADDPGCWSSVQTEEDTRWISYLGKIPTLEPSDSQEAKEMTKFAFKMSRKYKIPFLIRLTTRVSHTRSKVQLSPLKDSPIKAKFVKKDFTIGSSQTVHLHQKLLEKIEKIKKEIGEKSFWNYLDGDFSSNRIGALASGVSFFYLKEARERLKVNFPILKIGFSYPFPEKKVAEFIKHLRTLLVVEEIDDILESKIREIAKTINPNLKILGKNVLPRVGEMKPESVIRELAKIFKKKVPQEIAFNQKNFSKAKLPKRLPTFCSGCPHRATFWAVRTALGKKRIFLGDIGCYLLGALPPYQMSDLIVAMGAGMGIGHGISKASKKKPVIFIGDSTFFHAGLSALASLVYNQSNVLVIILDNRVTAMTGHQPHPGSGYTARGNLTKEIKIEDIARAMKVDKVEVAHVYNFQETVRKIKELDKVKGVSVLVARGECRLLTIRKLSQKNISLPRFKIVKQSPQLEKLKDFGCPAIKKKNNNYYIDENFCWGCGFCQQIFPDKIKPVLK